VPEHAAALVDEHCPHAPLGWQAGVAPPHWLSVVHAWHTCVAPLHTGVVPEQSALATQRTQVPAEVRQTGVAPEQAVALVAEHWPQAPPG
jgi:hypothetical protein